MSKLSHIANRTLRKSDLVYHSIKTNPSTQDIIDVILYAHGKGIDDTKAFAKYIPKTKQGLKDLFDLVRDDIDYEEDGRFKQHIKSPSALWKIDEGDCKSFSTFISSVLINMGIPVRYRFISEYTGRDVSHVYPIATLNGTDIIMDAVYGVFDNEPSYAYAVDYIPTDKGFISNKISGLSSVVPLLKVIFIAAAGTLAYQLIKKRA